MSLGLEEAAGLVGGHCWIERRLFELLGAWSGADGPVPAPTLVLDRHAQHAAWRAQQWWDRLPVLAGVDRDALVRPDGAWSSLDLLDHDLLLDPGPADTGSDNTGSADTGSADTGSADTGSADTGSDDTGSDDPGSDKRGIARLAVAYRVLLPRLAGRYARHQAGTGDVADGPVRRTLGHVRPDLAGDWVEGELLLQDLLVDAAAVTVAADAVSTVERLWTV